MSGSQEFELINIHFVIVLPIVFFQIHLGNIKIMGINILFIHLLQRHFNSCQILLYLYQITFLLWLLKLH